LATFEDGIEPRVVIISGEGTAFCSGLDLAELQQMSRKSYAESLRDARNYAQLLKRIYRHPKPIIAAVNGPALAGGCGLAPGFDLTLQPHGGYTEGRDRLVPVVVSLRCGPWAEEECTRELLTAKLIEAASLID
jgi:methylglutaconyl-CoA hydratase